VISPEEWAGAPTQQGHTISARLADPALAAVSLFNYLDARDAEAFVDAWLAAPATAIDGEGFFVGAADSLAERPVAELWREFAPGLGPAADALAGTEPVFSVAKAHDRLGWSPARTWRTELTTAAPTPSSARFRGERAPSPPRTRRETARSANVVDAGAETSTNTARTA
jgi:hypothetical protein